MQNICMPLLNKIPSNLISDVSPNTTMLFMDLWSSGSHKPFHYAAYGVIEGLDLPIAMFCSSDEAKAIFTGFDSCYRGHGDGDWVAIGCNLINTYNLYYKSPTDPYRYYKEFIVNTSSSGSYKNVTPSLVYTPNYFESLKDYLIPDLQTFYLMQEEYKKSGITFCSPEIRKITIINCSNYRLLHAQGDWISSDSLPSDVIGKTLYQISIHQRRYGDLTLEFLDYKKATLNTKARLAKGGKVIYSLS